MGSMGSDEFRGMRSVVLVGALSRTKETPETTRLKRGFGQWLILSSLWSLGSFRSSFPKKEKGTDPRSAPSAIPNLHHESTFFPGLLLVLSFAPDRSRAQEN